MIQFATKETIVQPKNRVPLPRHRSPKDHILGAAGFTGPTFEKLTGGHWILYIPPKVDIQRNIYGDTYGCESFSLNNTHQFVWKKRYGEDKNFCDRYLVVGSGTKPGVGNSDIAPAEWDRLNGWIDESRWPYSPIMTLDEYYNKGIVPSDLLAEGKANGLTTEKNYKYLANELPATRKIGLTMSPTRTSVEQYTFKGAHVFNSGTGYIHKITIFDFVDGIEWWGYDSENDQYVRFDWNYQFEDSMIHNIKKKSMTTYQVKGNSALFQISPSSGKLVPYGHGDVYKLANQIQGYMKPVVFNSVDELLKQFQFDDWIATKAPWDPQPFINSFK